MSLISPATSRRRDRLPLISLISDIRVYEDYKVAAARDGGAAARYCGGFMKLKRQSRARCFANMNFNSCPLLINLHKL